MNEIRMREDGRILSPAEYGELHPNTSFPAGKCFDDADVVAETAPPATGRHETAERDGAELVDGQWRQAWKVVPWTPEAIAADLLRARRAKELEINAWRTAANLSTFPHGNSRIACDQLSRSDIDAVANHVALFGAFPPEFPGAWKTVDNGYVPMERIDQFKAMYQSMAAQGTANFAYSQQLKNRVKTAQTIEEIEAITWAEPEQEEEEA